MELAKSQDARGMPFEWVRFYTGVSSLLMDQLAVFVDMVGCYDETLSDGDEY